MKKASSTRISRTGFRNAPAAVKAEADRIVKSIESDSLLAGGYRRAELRPTSYVGQDARTWTLAINAGGTFQLRTIPFEA